MQYAIHFSFLSYFTLVYFHIYVNFFFVNNTIVCDNSDLRAFDSTTSILNDFGDTVKLKKFHLPSNVSARDIEQMHMKVATVTMMVMPLSVGILFITSILFDYCSAYGPSLNTEIFIYTRTISL